MYGIERNRRERGCKSGVERYSEGECKRGEGRARRVREREIEGERRVREIRNDGEGR
jgi:hypothetical protein